MRRNKGGAAEQHDNIKNAQQHDNVQGAAGRFSCSCAESAKLQSGQASNVQARRVGAREQPEVIGRHTEITQQAPVEERQLNL